MSFSELDAQGETLEAALLRSVIAAGNAISELDEGIVEAGRRYARQIDAVTGDEHEVKCKSCGEVAVPDTTAITKALYLGPHYVNALRELGLTPAARQQDAANGEQVDPADEAFNDLARRKQQHARGRRKTA